MGVGGHDKRTVWQSRRNPHQKYLFYMYISIYSTGIRPDPRFGTEGREEDVEEQERRRMNPFQYSIVSTG
jgi:hypothetical protein